MKLHYFLSLGLLVTFNPLLQADGELPLKTQEGQIELQTKVPVEKQLTKKNRQTKPKEDSLHPSSLTEKQILTVETHDLSPLTLAKGVFSALTGMGALTASGVSLYDVHTGANGLKAGSKDYLRTCATSLAMLYVGVHALDTAYTILKDA